MQFFLLGPLEVRDAGREIPVTSRRQKVLLALLLLQPGKAVARDRLIDELWHGDPPETAENALHGLVSQVRKLLESPDAPMLLVTRAPGYVLEIDTEAVDVHRFEALVERGRRVLAGDGPDAGVVLLREALELWRGPPFEDLGDPPFARSEAARLDELRLGALEDRIEADLQLGQAEGLVPELHNLVDREPYRERFRGQLMLALYRAGRQADALAAYRDTRRHFAEELGIEPTTQLQELERAILRQDPSLAAPSPSRPATGGRRRVWWLVAAAAVAVVAGVASALLLRTNEAGKVAPAAAPDSVAVIDPKTNRLIDTVRVGSTPIAVAVGEGAVWAVNSQDGTLSRIDPRTRKVTRTIGLGTPASDVAVGFGSVWVANGTAGSLTRVDPRTNAPAETLYQRPDEPLVSPAALGIATGEGSLWLASGTRRVLRIDPESGRTIAAIRVPAGPLAVGVGEGAVWVGSLAHRVSRIEPRTDALTASVPVGNEAEGIAVGKGAVWAAVCCDSVWQIDPTTNVLTGTIQVGSVPSGVAIGEGSVWVSSYGDGTVSRINPFTRRVTATIHVGHGAVDVAVGYGAIWVAVEKRNVS